MAFPPFAVFVLIELLTFALSFFVASKGGKARNFLRASNERLASAYGKENKQSGLEKYSGVLEVRYYCGYTSRLLIFEYAERKYGYLTEKFEPKHKTWQFSRENIDFDDISELYDTIDFVYEDEMFEE